MFKSLRWRIIFPTVVLLLAVMVAVGVYSTRALRESYLSQTESSLTTQAHLLADSLQPALAGAEGSPSLAAEAAHWSSLIDARLTIVAPDGAVLADSEDDITRMDNHALRPEIVAAKNAGSGSSIRFSHTLGYDMLYTAVAVRDGDNLLGFVRLARPLDQLDVAISRMQQVWLAVAAGVSLAAVLLAVLISNRITKPLRQLTRESTLLAAGGETSGQAPTFSTDELQSLTQAFNLMSRSIQDKIQRLEVEKGKLNAILQAMSDGVLVVDDQDNVQIINQAACEMFAIEPLGEGSKNLIELTRQHQPAELLRKVKDTGQQQSLAFEILKTRQTVRAIAIPTQVYQPGLYLLVFHDLTEQKRVEALRRDFVSNVSHELRNPVAVIKMLSETLQDGAIADPESAQHFLSQIEKEADTLTAMVNELLDLSKAESGNLKLETRAVRPCQPINNARDRLALQAEKAGVMLRVDCPGDLPAVRADAVRLEQVLMNLVHNAIKFSKPGGEIFIRAKTEDAYMRYEVQDQGSGIAEEDLPHVFERFYKVDKSRTGEGTGLGLAVAKHLVEAQGGHITAVSALGEGSTFSFTIPLI
jgi:two-component system phosphate regulon sensor histidine kinase PhoR